jgi:hypothetical protein
MIRRLAKARSFALDVSLEIDELLNHVSSIAKLRDLLIHRGGTYIGGTIYSSNALIAKNIEDTELLKLNIKDIENATSDLAKIWVRLGFIADPPAPVSADYLAWMHEPWQYRHLTPDTPNRASPPKPQGRKRPPRASRASQKPRHT